MEGIASSKNKINFFIFFHLKINKIELKYNKKIVLEINSEACIQKLQNRGWSF